MLSLDSCPGWVRRRCSRSGTTPLLWIMSRNLQATDAEVILGSPVA